MRNRDNAEQRFSPGSNDLMEMAAAMHGDVYWSIDHYPVDTFESVATQQEALSLHSQGAEQAMGWLANNVPASSGYVEQSVPAESQQPTPVQPRVYGENASHSEVNALAEKEARAALDTLGYTQRPVEPRMSSDEAVQPRQVGEVATRFIPALSTGDAAIRQNVAPGVAPARFDQLADVATSTVQSYQARPEDFTGV